MFIQLVTGENFNFVMVILFVVRGNISGGGSQFYAVFGWYMGVHQGFALAAPLWLLLQERLLLLLAVR